MLLVTCNPEGFHQIAGNHSPVGENINTLSGMPDEVIYPEINILAACDTPNQFLGPAFGTDAVGKNLIQDFFCFVGIAFDMGQEVLIPSSGAIASNRFGEVFETDTRFFWVSRSSTG